MLTDGASFNQATNSQREFAMEKDAVANKTSNEMSALPSFMRGKRYGVCEDYWSASFLYFA